MSGPLTLRITVCHSRIPKTGLSSMGDRLLYEFPSGLHREDLDTKRPFLSDDADFPDLVKAFSQERCITKMLGIRTEWTGGDS